MVVIEPPQPCAITFFVIVWISRHTYPTIKGEGITSFGIDRKEREATSGLNPSPAFRSSGLYSEHNVGAVTNISKFSLI